MVYKVDKPELGITVIITPYRKHGNGAKGGGRKGSSGKKATITKDGEDKVTLMGPTATALLREVRKQFSIPSGVVINRTGETRI